MCSVHHAVAGSLRLTDDGPRILHRYNKKALKAFPYPLTCTAIQFGIGSLMALTMWALRLHERPKLEEDTVGAVIAHQRAGNHLLPLPVCGCGKTCHPGEQTIVDQGHVASAVSQRRRLRCSSKTSARWR